MNVQISGRHCRNQIVHEVTISLTIFGAGSEQGVGDVGADVALELTAEPTLVEVPVKTFGDLLTFELAS
jgi:hypothetical protein